MNIKIDDARILNALNFAIEYYDTKEVYQSEEKGDGQDRETRILNTLRGKIAEEAVADAFRARGEFCSDPDYKHYPRGSEMPSADLYCSGRKVHVKTCPMASSGLSWIADPTTDYMVNSPSEDDYIVFTAIDPDTLAVTIFGMAPCLAVKSKWDEPRAEWMAQKGKKAFYWSRVFGLGEAYEEFEPTKH
ncbi:hypothetical protein [Brevundimonas olei]|uniref:hypothetical protein n=1 Tax=Brevundimonas olei TaxID=657642 RepID=UPI0031DBD512